MRLRIKPRPKRPNYLLIAQRGRVEHEAALLLKSMSLLPAFDLSRVIVASPVNSGVWQHDPTPSAHFFSICRRFGVRTINFENTVFGDKYPISNKFYAIAAAGGEAPLVFIDSDMIFFKEPTFDFGRAGALICRAGDSFPRPENRGRRNEIWRAVYAHFGLDVARYSDNAFPVDHRERYPYFNAGTFAIDHRDVHSTYLDTALQLFYDPPEILKAERIFPFLDQIALPVALARAGCRWAVLPETVNRFEPAATVETWHYQFLFRCLIHKEPHVSAVLQSVREDDDLVQYLSDWPAFRRYVLLDDDEILRAVTAVIDAAAPGRAAEAVVAYLKSRRLPRK